MNAHAKHTNRLIQRREQLAFLVLWTAVGIATQYIYYSLRVGIMLITLPFSSSGLFRVMAFFIGWAIIGELAGIMQGIITRLAGFHLGRWASATATGWGIGGVLSTFTWMTTDDFVRVWLTPVLLGLAIGLTQWTVLQKYVQRAICWIPANGIGMMLMEVDFIIGGAVYGLISGSVMVALWRKSVLASAG
jgi:hypothetical protein